MKPATVKPTVTYDDFAKLDIRVGTIEVVEDVERSDKLVRLNVNFGDHTRKILVGMKGEWENPKEIEGKQTLFVVNLEPKKMMSTPLPPMAGSADVSRLRLEMDEVSEGMLFDIGYADKMTPVLAIPEKMVPDGTRAG